MKHLKNNYQNKEPLKLNWGNPPKPNIWWARLIRGSILNYVYVSSPVLNSDILFKIGETQIGEGFVRVIILPNVEGSLLHSKRSDLSYFASNVFWDKLYPVLLEQGALKKEFRVASSEPKVMWGDPPKPNLWKLEEGVRGAIRIDGFVKSPLFFKPIKYSYLVKFRELVIRILTNKGHIKILEVLEDVDYAEGLEELASHGFWQRNKDEIKKHCLKTDKVASSEIKVMWGDPPKPNLWKLEKVFEDTVKIKSPLFKDGQNIRIQYYMGQAFIIIGGQNLDSFYTPTFELAIQEIASKAFWRENKNLILPHLKIDKVASSELERN